MFRHLEQKIRILVEEIKVLDLKGEENSIGQYEISIKVPQITFRG